MRLSMIKKLLYINFLALLFVPSVLFAQVKITGRVTDAASGEELPGTNVYIKSLQLGTSADINGNYVIENVPSGTYEVVASYVGYKQFKTNVTVGNSDVTLDLMLEPDFLGLEEVFVTAYGLEKTKNELSYSAQKVDGGEVSASSTGNFVSSLSGRVAGVQIQQTNSMGGSTNIVIRGYKSLTGNNQALFVVDGVPYDNSNTNGGNQQTGRGGYDYGSAAADINPEDIESINVLKGAAATALYGSRAANGVVLIITKKGRKGQELGITVNSGVQVGVIDKSTFIDYQKQYGAGYGPYYSGGNYPGLEEFDIDGDGTDDLVVPTYEDASYGQEFDKSLLVYQWDAFDPASPNYGKKTPWVAAANDPTSFFETAVTYTNSVFIEGGTNKGFYKLGYNNVDEGGILPNSSLSKNLVNFSASYDITKQLTASASVNLSKIEGKGRYGTGYDDKNLMTNFRQWWQVNVDVKDQKDAYFRNKVNATWNWNDNTAIGSMPGPIYWDNPYFTRYENYQNDNRDRYFSNIQMQYKPLDWMSVTGRVALDSYDEFQEERQAVGSVSPASYTRYNRSFREFNYDLLVNFNKKFTDFSISGLVGSNIRRSHITSIFAGTNGGLVIPRLYSLSNSLNQANAPTESDVEVGVDGYFGNATFNFKDFLIVEGSLRRDQSSTLPDGANTFYYPSVSAGFVFSELLGNSLEGILDYGKFRVSYASVGNSAPAYSILDDYVKPTPYGDVPLFSVPSTKRNPDLKPESTDSFEAGVEMTFLKGLIGFDVAYYQSSTIDQIIPVSISTATGFSSKYINAGEVDNKGFEATIYTKPIATKDFTWNLDFNWSKNENKVVSLAEGIDNLQLATLQGGVSINAVVGEPFGTIRGRDFIYDENGNKVVGANGFYMRTSTSNEIIGDMNPDWLGSISNRFAYKSLAMSFLIDIRSGGDIFSLDQYYGQGTGLPAFTAEKNDLGNPVRDPVTNDATSGGIILPGVLEDGTTNNIRVNANSYAGPYGWARNPNAAFVYDGSFVKLREVTLTYTVPKDLVRKTNILTGVDITFRGRNLWIISKNMPDADPEEQFSSGNISGYQGGAYPTTRTFAINLKLKF